MRVLLDDSACPVQARYAGAAVAAACAVAEEHGRLVVEVHVDGEPWCDERLDDLEGDRTEASEVRLVTAEPRALITQTLDDASGALQAADALQREAAELLESRRAAVAMQKLGEAIAIWSSVQQAVALCGRVIALDLDRVTVDGVPAEELVRSLTQRLASLRGALEVGDHVGLSDTLRYELPPVVQEWRDLLAELIRLVNREPSQP
jgi:hypothetical protein